MTSRSNSHRVLIAPSALPSGPMPFFEPLFSSTLSFTNEERVEIRRRAKQLVARRRGTWLVMLVLVVVLPVAISLLPKTVLFLSAWGIPRVLAIVLVNLTTTGGLLGLVFFALHRIRVRAVREAVRELGYPICIECGYDLRSEQSLPDRARDRCPECGSRR